MNIEYNYLSIRELHNIINLYIINRLIPLETIESDNDLTYKYVTIKSSINLYIHRILVNDRVGEIGFKNLVKMEIQIFEIK